jgi:hypothetical protein
MRSADEHPLRLSDLQRLAARFESAEHRFFSLLTLAAVPLRSARLLDALAALDRWILRVPWVRRFAWIVVTELRAPA